MLAIQTIVVYLLMFAVMLVFFKMAARTGKNFYIVYGVLIFAITSGFRYCVGTDFFAYMQDYEYVRITGLKLSEFEQGYQSLVKLIASSGLHYGWFFGIIGFLQLMIISMALKKDKNVYPYFVFAFVMGAVWLSYWNGIRQAIAFSFWVLSIRYIVERKPFVHYFILFMALMFHNSAAALFVFYPIFVKKSEWFHNVKMQYVLFAVSLILMSVDFIQNILNQFDKVAIFMGYEGYTDERYLHKVFSQNVELGLGFYITLFVNVILVGFSNKAKIWYGKSFFCVIYDLYFVGVLLKYAFISSQLIQRFNWYFVGFDYIVTAYMLYYLYNKKRNMFYIVVGLYLLTFVAYMYRMEENTVMYVFNFQEEYFGLKHRLYR